MFDDQLIKHLHVSDRELVLYGESDKLNMRLPANPSGQSALLGIQQGLDDHKTARERVPNVMISEK